MKNPWGRCRPPSLLLMCRGCSELAQTEHWGASGDSSRGLRGLVCIQDLSQRGIRVFFGGVREMLVGTEGSTGEGSPCCWVYHLRLVSLDGLVEMLLQWVQRASQSLLNSLMWCLNLLADGKCPTMSVLSLSGFPQADCFFLSPPWPEIFAPALSCLTPCQTSHLSHTVLAAQDAINDN